MLLTNDIIEDIYYLHHSVTFRFQCGSDIISSFSGDHPLADVIISGVRAHVGNFGDGAKSVALLLSGFLKALETKGLVRDGEGRCRILAQIRNGGVTKFQCVSNRENLGLFDQRKTRLHNCEKITEARLCVLA